MVARRAEARDTANRTMIGICCSSESYARPVLPMVQDLLLESLEYRFGQSEREPHPLEWLTDNGSCYIAKETRVIASSLDFVVCTTPVRSHQSNDMAEAFVKTFKRDYVYLNDLPDAATVMAKLPEWIEDYNRSHRHKGLKMKSPWEHRAELPSNE